MNKTGRNVPCPCGSGEKYKKCCARNPPAPASQSTTISPRIAFQTALDHLRNGHLNQADAICQAVLQRTPRHADTLHLAGLIAYQQQNFENADAYIRQAIAIKPRENIFHLNLGNALQALHRFDEAIACYRRAISLAPNFAEAFSNMGNALQAQGHWGEAMDCFRQALSIAPDYADAQCNLGNALQALGRLDEAAKHYRQALLIQPDDATSFSNLLLCMIHDESLSPEECHTKHIAFADHFEGPLRRHWRPHDNDRTPQRRLKVGFVSGDLRNHAIAHFIEPIWTVLDPAAIESWVYSNAPHEDEVSLRLRRLVANWRRVIGTTDEELAATIRADGIDILIDLSGHTGHNRLLTFARKPAPVQASWIGYPGTTGLSAIDYLICDRYNAPHDLYERYYSEHFARLPSAAAFEPLSEAPPLSPLPALSNGYITFASFNQQSKLGESVISAWSEVLRALPDARLLLGHINGDTQRTELSVRFARYGIAADRLSFHPKLPMADYLALHHQVDIILDTWPYTGGTTTNHALWMGIPVVTMRGPSRSHCQSAAIISRTRLEDWVANDVSGFIRIAIERATDIKALAALRGSMRERWLGSPLRNANTVARGLEAGLREMWQRWCAQQPATAFEISEDTVSTILATTTSAELADTSPLKPR